MLKITGPWKMSGLREFQFRGVLLCVCMCVGLFNDLHSNLLMVLAEVEDKCLLCVLNSVVK